MVYQYDQNKSQNRVLLAIYRSRDGLTPKQICEDTGMTITQVYGACNELKKRFLIVVEYSSMPEGVKIGKNEPPMKYKKATYKLGKYLPRIKTVLGIE